MAPNVGDVVDVKVTILRYFDPEPQPGVVEFSLIDRFGQDWLFRGKVPDVSHEMLDEGDSYPRDGTLRGSVVSLGVDAEGRSFAEIDTSRPWHVESIAGVSTFQVRLDRLLIA